ncbi:MAG TPA: F0F1 ATP synthase subunit alpha, partial [Anaerolineae bacterium]|nr:F0F1 ATP synthase subunit alpha [Anaerolineae bacterium]
AFAQFGSDLDRSTRDQLERGLRLTELLKQPQYQPIPLDEQVISIYALTNGFAREVPVEKIREYVDGLISYLKSNHPGVGQALSDQKNLTDDIEAALRAGLTEYNQSHGYAVPQSK